MSEANFICRPDRMSRWRHLIEPTLQDGPISISWEDVVVTPVLLLEGERSVLVAVEQIFYKQPTWLIWIAAGEVEEILSLNETLEAMARAAGIKQTGYMGRVGWTAVAGFDVKAVIATKGL